MQKLNLKDLSQYVENHIGIFHLKRIQSLESLKLSQVLKRKNPYLFKAKYVLTAEQIIKGFVDAHISSNEETIFGDWLEGLAIFINSKVFGGKNQALKELTWSLTRTMYAILSLLNLAPIGAIALKLKS